MNRHFLLAPLFALVLVSICSGQQQEPPQKLAMPPKQFKVTPQSGAAFDKADAIFQPALAEYGQYKDTLDSSVIPALRKAAKQGHARAMYCLGELAEFGDHVMQDDQTAFAWFERSAAFGDLEAMQKVAQCLDFGRGVKEDPKKSKLFYGKILETLETQNTAESQLRLAEIYIEDDFYLGKEPLKGEAILKKLADDGNMVAHQRLHDLYYFGSGEVAKDLNKSFQHAKLVADKTGAKACLESIAEMLMHGAGCEKNIKMAEEYYYKAHEAGSCLALIGLSGVYLKGEIVEKDVDKAVEILRGLIAEENTAALLLLTEMYESGNHVKADMKKAIELWEIGRKWGLARAFERLHKLYSRGKFEDPAKAKKVRAELEAWYERNEIPAEYRKF